MGKLTKIVINKMSGKKFDGVYMLDNKDYLVNAKAEYGVINIDGDIIIPLCDNAVVTKEKYKKLKNA